MTKDIGFRFASILVLPLAMGLATGPVHADSKADVAAELRKAQELEARGKFPKACKAYQHASEMAQGQSAPSLIGLSKCYTQQNERDKAVATARQALAVVTTPEERTEVTTMLGFDLLRQPDEHAWTEALTLFKQQVEASGGSSGQAGVLTALLALHRDQEAAEILQDLRKQGKSEDDIQEQVLSRVTHPGSQDDQGPLDDFNERLLRLDPDVPLRVGGNVKRPEILSQVKPETTVEARRHRGFDGTVILETTIDTEGRVGNVRVLRGLPMGLTEAAVDAVKAWTFKPSTFNGKPVKVWYVLTVRFQIY